MPIKQSNPSPASASDKETRGADYVSTSGSDQMQQADLFEAMLKAYENSDQGVLDNATLYREVAKIAGLPVGYFERKSAVGKKGRQYALAKRQLRWYQQTLKAAGVLERDPDHRGVWSFVDRVKAKKGQTLHQIGSVSLVAFSTHLGVAILGSNVNVLPHLDQQVTLLITSPPYPLRQPRSYGNVAAQEWVDFICRAIEPVLSKMVRGGSICLNVSNDCFEEKSPARSTYIERMVIAFEDRLGLKLMDRIIWSNPSKAPGPTYWASITRTHLNTGYEPVLWFTNDPLSVKANNRRVLQPHSERHIRLMEQGGDQRQATYGDGAFNLRAGKSFSHKTDGAIPKNVLTIGHSCSAQREYIRSAKEQGLTTHGACFPLRLPSFLIDFLTEEGDLVVDMFGGIGKAGLAAEMKNRRWLVVEWILQYLQGGSVLFRDFPGYRGSALLGT